MADDKKTKTRDEAVDLTNSKTQTDLGDGTHADRVSDRAPLPTDVDGMRDKLDPKLGERLAEEAAEKRSATGGDIKIVEKNGVRSAVREEIEDRSDNGKVYSDVRINPRDTNAPDAGLTPDGRRIAE